MVGAGKESVEQDRKECPHWPLVTQISWYTEGAACFQMMQFMEQCPLDEAISMSEVIVAKATLIQLSD